MKPPRRSTPPPAASASGKIRLIGGRWRGTRLSVPDAPGLRPTSDRVRETLFNWLMPMLPGARVLDLFAGTGALGLEAVSRGAGSAVLVERDAALAAALRETVARLKAQEQVQVMQADAAGWLGAEAADGFDIAFVDPPFAAGLWQQVLPLLDRCLRADAWLYVESPEHAVATPGPGWLLHREGRTREVRYALFQRAAPRDAERANDAIPAVR